MFVISPNGNSPGPDWDLVTAPTGEQQEALDALKWVYNNAQFYGND